MSDDGDFDPNADVPLWVNIVVPIMSGIMFFAVVVLLFRTDKEIPLDTLKDWANRIPVLNKWLLPDDPARVENKLARERNNVSTAHNTVKQTEKSERSYLNIGYNVDRYDSISSIKTQETTGTVSEYSDRRSYYASRGTLVSFETNV